jgi:TrmH family RNA methyltransferase
MISSAQNPKIKLVRALMGRSRERRQAGAFVAEGVRLVEEALAAGWTFKFVLYDETLSERGRLLVHRLQAAQIDVGLVSASLMNSLGETETPQGILAVLALPRLEIVPPGLDFVLILDQIRDPGNLGTLLRTAAAAGVQAVFLSPETVDAFAPKVVRAGMGAHFRFPVLALSWEQIRQACEQAGLQVWLADMDGISCWQADLKRPLGLIIGGEADGASPSARALAHDTISIPMPGGTESLNAAVAGAVLMFEVVRQEMARENR